MASHIEMKRLAEDADAVRTLARFLHHMDDCDWSDWELDFLDSMASRDTPEPLSMRQREVLVELRDRAELARDWRGIPIRRLIEQTHLARLDLDEDDEAFVIGLADRWPTSLRKGQLARLVRLAARVGVIEPYLTPSRGARVDTDRAA